MFKKIIRTTDKINEWCIKISCVFLLVVVVSCLIQMLTRFLPFFRITGFEEIARYAFIWMTFIGLGAGVGMGIHPAVTVIRDALPAKCNIIFEIISNTAVFVFGIIFIIYGYDATKKMSQLVSTSFRINMKYIYLATVVGGVLVVGNAIVNYLRMISARGCMECQQ